MSTEQKQTKKKTPSKASTPANEPDDSALVSGQGDFPDGISAEGHPADSGTEKPPLMVPILAEDGHPYSTDRMAHKAMIQRGMSPRIYTVVPYQTGWCIASIKFIAEGGLDPRRRSESKAMEAAKTVAEQLQTQFMFVTFLPAADENAPQQVELGLNGEWFLFPRGVRTVCPETHLEVARHAAYLKYENDENPETGGIYPSHDVSKLPYQTHGEATRADFLDVLQRGGVQHSRRGRF